MDHVQDQRLNRITLQLTYVLLWMGAIMMDNWELRKLSFKKEHAVQVNQDMDDGDPSILLQNLQAYHERLTVSSTTSPNLAC